MKKSIKHILSTASLLMALLVTFPSCTDDEFYKQSDDPYNGHLGEMVEVTIPFRMGKGITANVETRAAGTDSQLSSIMVFVYENKTDSEGKPVAATENKRVGFYLFENPENSSNLDFSDGGWIEDGTDNTCGKIKFHVPVGPCYIYLIGNYTGSFLNFFPEMGLPVPDDGKDELETLDDFWQKIKPQWNGNMNTVDGYLPLVGKVNNENGDCEVIINNENKVVIQYTGTDGNTHYLDPDNTNFAGEHAPVDEEYVKKHSFVLQRLMSKVTVNIETKKGVTFTPETYRFRHVAQYVSPIEGAITHTDIPVTDTEAVPFSTQSPNGFEVYLPENVRTAQKHLTSFAEREEVQKEENTIVMETGEGHTEHYAFENAPANSTYMEITGHYEGPGDDGTTPVSADTRYFIHLGDFGTRTLDDGTTVTKGYDDFSLRRDYHYTYTITVNGVNSIYAEVEGKEDGTHPDAPGAESIIFEGGAHVRLDAHYEQVEMKFTKKQLEKGIYIYADTPYGTIDCHYTPATGNQTEGTIANNKYTQEYIKQITSWIQLRKQDTGRGVLALYHPNEVTDILTTLDNINKGTDEGETYYTCFVNEYYYETAPDGSSTTLSKFINAPDRTFSLGSSLTYSPDGKSAVAKAVYVLQQRSIACFYQLDGKRAAYGVETVDETGGKGLITSSPIEENKGSEGTVGLNYNAPNTNYPDDVLKNGRQNTINETQGSRGVVNWVTNGWLLNDKNELVQGEGRLNNDDGYLACLTRNRDWNGDGSLSDDEIRWYTPALHQVLGLWVGEPSMPAEAALFPEKTDVLNDFSSSTCVKPIYTSSPGNDRRVWAEQGSSYGGSSGRGFIRAVRNLGAAPNNTSHTMLAQPYYQYKSSDRTIEVFLSNAAVRAFSNNELAPHHERSEVNRPPRKFQVAKHPYVTNETAVCGGWTFHNAHSENWIKIQTSNSQDARTKQTTIAANYPGDGETVVAGNANWRLPNQRELTLMVIAMKTVAGELDYAEGIWTDEYGTINKRDYYIGTYTHTKHRDHSSLDGRDFKFDDYDCQNCLLQCRTTFSNTTYAYQGAPGYMYNTGGNMIQMFWESGDVNAGVPSGGQILGQGKDGTAGYLCVRDVQ